MKALLQRVRSARVEVADEVVGQIEQGLLVLVGVEPTDTPETAAKLLHKLLNYRVFSDDNGKMNCSLKDIQGGLLLVSQFTLVADTKSGMRPSFSKAAPPALGAVSGLRNWLSWPKRRTQMLRLGNSVRICRCI